MRTTSCSLTAAVLALAPFWLVAGAVARAQDQEPEIERAGPPAVDDLEKDANGDGVPDGWYNARDAIWEAKGGVAGPHFIRFDSPHRGRPARLSRAFGVDGRKTEAIILGVWIRGSNIQYGERSGEEPSLLIDFLGDGLRQLSRGAIRALDPLAQPDAGPASSSEFPFLPALETRSCRWASWGPRGRWTSTV